MPINLMVTICKNEWFSQENQTYRRKSNYTDDGCPALSQFFHSASLS